MDSIEKHGDLNYHEIVKSFINDKCLFIADPEKHYCDAFPKGRFAHGNFSKKTGSRWQFYMKRLLYDIEKRNQLMEVMLPLLPVDENIQLAGLETSSIPFMQALQEFYWYEYQYNINFFSVKKERADTGLFHYVEGIPNEHPVMFVDDIIASGRSLYSAMGVVCNELKLPVYSVTLAIIDRQLHDIPDMEIRAPYKQEDFDYTFNENRYWEPKDIL